jgi:hypothetical protein
MARSFKETAMSDDPKKTGLDRKLISLDEPHEVPSCIERLGAQNSNRETPSRRWATVLSRCAFV